MWSTERDRTDDPLTHERETQRLAKDEYDRPRYGSPRARAAQRTPEPRHQVVPDRASCMSRSSGGQPRERGARDIDDLRVHELMTRRVTSVHPSTSVERAARLMKECDCGALPVIGDSGVLVGIITDRDISIRIVARGRDARSAIVADCMTERVFACYANESVPECMRQMASHQVRRMPIVDDRGRLVGIIAQGDLARHAGLNPLPEEPRALTEVVCALSQPVQVPTR